MGRMGFLLRILICSVAVFVLFVSPAGSAELSKEEIHDLYSRGKDFFRKANDLAAEGDGKGAKALYQKAVLRFERLSREAGIENGKLYFNIGNIYFRMNDLGRAVLNYRKAERYIPNDPNLRRNLEYARSLRVDKLEDRPRRKIMKTLLFWHYDVASQYRSLIFVAANLLFWIGAGLRLFRLKFPPKWLFVSLFAVACLFLGSVLVEERAESSRTAGVVVAKEVVARKGDGESYQPSFRDPLHAGTEFELVESRGEWRLVELVDGRRCWLPANKTELER